MEKWEQIKENPNYYISNLGRFKRGDVILKVNTNKRGYVYCNMSTNSIVTKIKIHRMVATYFVENPLLKETVNHKDGNKLNNHYLNLEWLTRKENIQHYFKSKKLNNTEDVGLEVAII